MSSPEYDPNDPKNPLDHRFYDIAPGGGGGTVSKEDAPAAAPVHPASLGGAGTQKQEDSATGTPAVPTVEDDAKKQGDS